MHSCSSYITTFSSLVSFCIVYASTKWCSLALYSFDSLIYIESINVTPSPVCSLACQRCLLMHKNSIVDVLVVFMSWIIVYANFIFTLYIFPSPHSENDDECNGDLTTNDWIFNTPLSALFNSSFISILFNNSVSSYYLHLCSHSSVLPFPLLFAIVFNCTHTVVNSKTSKMCTTSNNKHKLLSIITLFIFILEHLAHHIHFSFARHLLINAWSSKLIHPIITSLCVH